MMKVLIYLFLANHFLNIRCHHHGKQRFEDTSGIFNLILMLAERYPHLLVYICFQCRDYPSLMKQFAQRLPKKYTESHQLASTTFVECVFQLRYFDLNPQDLFAMTKVFAGCNTGVTFIQSQDSTELWDISYAALLKVMSCIEMDFKQRRQSSLAVECYGMIYNNLCALSCILNSMSCSSLKNVCYRRDFSFSFGSLLSRLLHAITSVMNTGCLILDGHIDTILVSVLSRYYELHLKVASTDQQQVNKVKREAYLSLLQKQTRREEELRPRQPQSKRDDLDGTYL